MALPNIALPDIAVDQAINTGSRLHNSTCHWIERTRRHKVRLGHKGGTETDLSQHLLVGLLPNNITRKSQTKDLFVPLFDLSINSKKAFNMLALVYLRHSNSFLLLLNGKLEQLRVSLI